MSTSYPGYFLSCSGTTAKKTWVRGNLVPSASALVGVRGCVSVTSILVPRALLTRCQRSATRDSGKIQIRYHKNIRYPVKHCACSTLIETMLGSNTTWKSECFNINPNRPFFLHDPRQKHMFVCVNILHYIRHLLFA